MVKYVNKTFIDKDKIALLLTSQYFVAQELVYEIKPTCLRRTETNRYPIWDVFFYLNLHISS